MLTRKLCLESVKIEQITPFEKNPKKHTAKQINMLKKSIQEFGFTNPILLAEGDVIVAGHARLQAAKGLGLSEVPVIRLDMPVKKAAAYVIGDNRLSYLAEEDADILAELLAEIDLDFDVEALGYGQNEIDDLLKSIEQIDVSMDNVNLYPVVPVDTEKHDVRRIETPVQIVGGMPEHRRPEYDEEKYDRGVKKDTNWFFVSYYGEDERFKEIGEMMGDNLKSTHEINPEFFEGIINEISRKKRV